MTPPDVAPWRCKAEQLFEHRCRCTFHRCVAVLRATENDLAMMDVYERVPSDVFDAYRDMRKIDKGFEQRSVLWRIPIYLAATVDVSTPFGCTFLTRLHEALRTFT